MYYSKIRSEIRTFVTAMHLFDEISFLYVSPELMRNGLIELRFIVGFNPKSGMTTNNILEELFNKKIKVEFINLNKIESKDSLKKLLYKYTKKIGFNIDFKTADWYTIRNHKYEWFYQYSGNISHHIYTYKNRILLDSVSSLDDYFLYYETKYNNFKVCGGHLYDKENYIKILKHK